MYNEGLLDYCEIAYIHLSIYIKPGTPQALLQSCATFAAFSCIMEGLNKQQAAMAQTLGGSALTVSHQNGGVLPPFTLPPLLDASDALSSCCQSLVLKPKH
jgi:import inner membrane translocase subunit TIM22